MNLNIEHLSHRNPSNDYSQKDYHPGGMVMPGRIYNSNSYRFGYNKGSENDDEISGSGNKFTTLFREGDTRLSTWWSPDPKTDEQPDQSPYSYMDGNPILLNDRNGDCPWCLWGAVIGAGVDYAAQVGRNYMNNDPNPWTNIDRNEIMIATGAGAVSGGLSTLYAAGGAVAVGGVALSQTTSQGVVVGVTSVGMQVNSNINEDKDPLNISPVKTAIDIVSDGVAGKVADKLVPKGNFKTLENQLDRTTNISAKDPKSSGRLQNMQKAELKLNTAKNINFGANNAMENIVSTGVSTITEPGRQTNTSIPDIQFDMNQNMTMPSDATRVKITTPH